MSNKRFGVSWREGEPHTARKWHGWLGETLVAISFFRFLPRNLRRVSSTWWWYPGEGTPQEIAQRLENLP